MACFGQMSSAQDSDITDKYVPSFWQKHIFNRKNTVEVRVLRPLESSYYFDGSELRFGLQNTVDYHKSLGSFREDYSKYLAQYGTDIFGLRFHHLRRFFLSFSYARQFDIGSVYFRYNKVGGYRDVKPIKHSIFDRVSSFYGIGYMKQVWNAGHFDVAVGAEATYRGGGALRVDGAVATSPGNYSYQLYSVTYKDFGLSIPLSLKYNFNNGLLIKCQARYAYFIKINEYRTPRHFLGSGLWLGYRF